MADATRVRDWVGSTPDFARLVYKLRPRIVPNEPQPNNLSFATLDDMTQFAGLFARLVPRQAKLMVQTTLGRATLRLPIWLASAVPELVQPISPKFAPNHQNQNLAVPTHKLGNSWQNRRMRELSIDCLVLAY